MANESRPLCLIVPGLDNSGRDHWQTLWEDRRDDCRRVDLGCWSEPDRRIWTERLDAGLAMTDGPVVLVAHSLGCLTIAWWAIGASAERLARIRGALLVAPPDVDAPDAHPFVRRFAPTPAAPLPFRSILVASRNDRYAAFDRLEAVARAWGSRFVDAGHAGHINAQSGLGDWPDGEVLLDELIDSSTREPAGGRGPASPDKADRASHEPGRAYRSADGIPKYLAVQPLNVHYLFSRGREILMFKRARVIIAIVLIALIGIYYDDVRDFWNLDTCLDRGGSWNEQHGLCQKSDQNGKIVFEQM